MRVLERARAEAVEPPQVDEPVSVIGMPLEGKEGDGAEARERRELRSPEVVRLREIDPRHGLRVHALQPAMEPGPGLEPGGNGAGIAPRAFPGSPSARRLTAAIASLRPFTRFTK